MTGPAFSLAGKTALVTGAGQGIGAAIVTRFAEAGARVVAANRTVEPARALAASLVKRGLDVAAEPFADLSRTGLTKLVERVAREGLDILVHNAGSCPWAGLEEMSEEVLDAALDVNLRACFWLTQAAIPHFRARGEGRILVTSSVTGPRAAMVRAAHYAAAKAGVNGFIRAAALELACDRITVNGVEPGFIAKPGRGELGGAETMARIAGYIPLGAMGEADDVAYAMLYLASPQAKYVTGQTIVVDGGALLPETGYAMDATRRAS